MCLSCQLFYATSPDTELENIRLAKFIKECDERFHHILGYQRMTSWINHFNHTTYNKNRLHRILKRLGIHSEISKEREKYKYSTPKATAENKFSRNFYATAPNPKWTTDVTEFKILGGKSNLYSGMLLDLYDRYLVSYVISSRNDSKLVFRTFDLGPVHTKNSTVKSLSFWAQKTYFAKKPVIKFSNLLYNLYCVYLNQAKNLSPKNFV